jgi:hypothetical protein
LVGLEMLMVDVERKGKSMKFTRDGKTILVTHETGIAFNLTFSHNADAEAWLVHRAKERGGQGT